MYSTKIVNMTGYLLLDTGRLLIYKELILGLHPANEWRRYKVTPSLIGWVQT